MEDFNTGTLPHRKYYNVDAYEAEKAAKAAKRQKPLVRIRKRQSSTVILTRSSKRI